MQKVDKKPASHEELGPFAVCTSLKHKSEAEGEWVSDNWTIALLFHKTTKCQ